jgi:hypothetical protein
VKIVSEIAHRALTYVALTKRQGYKVSERQLEAFVRSPDRVGASYDIAGLTAAFDITRMLRVKKIPGETLANWLVRLDWLAIEDGKVELTRLGEAILRAADEQDVETELPLRIVLDPTDPLSYAKVIGRIAEMGSALLVDPYFGLDQLLVVLQGTSVTRVLVGPKTNIGALATATASLVLPREFIIRVSPQVHDRFVIPPAGGVDALGTSLNGVGRKFTVMTSLQGPVADTIRAKHEELWEAAKPVAIDDAEALKPTPAAKPKRGSNGG